MTETATKPVLLLGATAELSFIEQAKRELTAARETLQSRVSLLRDFLYSKLIGLTKDSEVRKLLTVYSQNERSILTNLLQVLVDEGGELKESASFCCSGFCLSNYQSVIQKIKSRDGNIFAGLAFLRIEKADKGYCFYLATKQ